jgi:hypothetical protein
VVGSAQEADVAHVRQLCAGLQCGEIVLFDRAYLWLEHCWELTQRGVFFVTRAREPDGADWTVAAAPDSHLGNAQSIECRVARRPNLGRRVGGNERTVYPGDTQPRHGRVVYCRRVIESLIRRNLIRSTEGKARLQHAGRVVEIQGVTARTEADAGAMIGADLQAGWVIGPETRST